MEKEIISLESCKKIGIIDCLCQGITAFFKNFVPFCKMLLPILWIALSSILLGVSTFFVIISMTSENIIFIIFAVLFFIFSACVFGYSFWRYLIGMVAVSYLAKDIYENKEIQNQKDYYYYVDVHTKSYAKYWLYNALLSIGWIIILAVLCKGAFYIFQNYISLFIPYIIGIIAFLIISIPFVIGLAFSTCFWAYQDKNKPYEAIKNAIKISYKKVFAVFGYFILLYISIFAIEYLLRKISPVLSTIFDLFAGYFTIFIMTRYYFDIIKD